MRTKACKSLETTWMDETTGPAVTRHFEFGARFESQIRVADTAELRERAWGLAYKAYRDQGYAKPSEDALWYGLHDALPDTTTFLVTKNEHAVAAMTLIFDSPLGLPADSLYAAELDSLRAKGRRVCEISALVSQETDRRSCVETLKHMFKLGYLTARRLEQATDFVIMVNPDHQFYHTKKLLFEQFGEQKPYDKVAGAPAVLLRLNLETAEARYREKYGAEPGSLYSFFINPETEVPLLELLRRTRGSLDWGSLTTWFAERRPLLSEAAGPVRDYLMECYSPESELQELDVAESVG